MAKLTLAGLKQSGLTEEQAKKVLEQQDAPVVQRRLYVIDVPMSDDEATALLRHIRTFKGMSAASLVKRFKSQAEKAKEAKTATAKKS